MATMCKMVGLTIPKHQRKLVRELIGGRRGATVKETEDKIDGYLAIDKPPTPSRSDLVEMLRGPIEDLEDREEYDLPTSKPE